MSVDLLASFEDLPNAIGFDLKMCSVADALPGSHLSLAAMGVRKCLFMLFFTLIENVILSVADSDVRSKSEAKRENDYADHQ